MDWRECINKQIVKDAKQDNNLINSLKEVSEKKIRSAKILPSDLHVVKISLLYDALREILEAISLKNGYKVYNHECFTSFIKEVLGFSYQGDEFDLLRKTRNAINYYGKDISEEESKDIISKLEKSIKFFKNKL
ncbi:MAG: hypothetical protein AB7V77_00760 [Candidatus Woesearchaeota archaeon]